MEPFPENQSPNWNQDIKPGRQSRTPKRTVAKRCKKKTWEPVHLDLVICKTLCTYCTSKVFAEKLENKCMQREEKREGHHGSIWTISDVIAFFILRLLRDIGYYPRWRPLFHCQLHVPANDVFQDLPGRWCLLTCVMSGRFQEFLDRLLLEWRAARREKSSWQVTKSGIPQGTVLGPTLFLIYINDFPSCIDNDVSIFADDTTVYTIGLPINQNATAISLTADLNNADLWARIWGMLFNADKSEILSIRSQRAAASLQESDPVIHPISMNGVRVPACQKHKHLGVVINNSLSWSDHIDDVFTKCARHVGILNSLRKKLSKRCLTRIYKGYIRPRLEYACAVWSGGNTSKLLKLQQKFCRQHQVQLPNLSNRFKFHTLTLFYKIRNGLAPTYLSEILPETLALSSGRNLRRHVYPFPRINKSSTMQSFLPRATVFWNELPASIQSSSSLHSFKAKLRDLLKI